MSKVLIIKGANFFENKIDTIIIGPEPPEINISSNGLVTITSPEIGLQIYYTTDGSTPTINSTLYSIPFTVEENTIVKAICTNEDHSRISDVASKTYAKAWYILPQTTVFVSNQENQIVEDKVMDVSKAYTLLIKFDMGSASRASNGLSGVISSRKLRIWGASNYPKGKVTDSQNLLNTIDNDLLNSGNFLGLSNIVMGVIIGAGATGNVQFYNNKNNSWKSFTNVEGDNPLFEKLVIGGWVYDPKDSTYNRRMNGTIYKLEIYEEAYTQEQVVSWVNANA